MHSRILNVAVCLSFAVFAPVLGFIPVSPDGGDQGATGTLTTLEESLLNWTTQNLENLSPDAEGVISTAVNLEGTEYELSLRPHSVRSESFTVQVQLENGELVEVQPPAPVTYRGVVSGIPGSVAAASLMNGQLTAIIDLGDGEIWSVEPLSKYDEAAGAQEHVVYRSLDLVPTEYYCGTDLIDVPENIEFQQQDRQDTEAGIGIIDEGSDYLQNDKVAEVAFDADYEFYQANGSSVANTIADIENVLNGVDVIYQRDVEICYNITHIIVRSTSNDPYTGRDPSSLLQQFRVHWNQEQDSIERDLAHLMTGRDLYGGVIGIAYMDGVCNMFGYSLSQSRYTWNFTYRIALSAHELGHNWNASHCSGNTCKIMCPVLGGCSGIVTEFGPQAIDDITTYKETRNCIDDGCHTTLDLVEPEPGEAGEVSTFSVRGATPNGWVGFFYGLQTGSTDIPQCPGVELGLANAHLFGISRADDDGIATFDINVPNYASGVTVLFQAGDAATCELSEVVSYSFP
ncbi:MAG: zinc-dependent metalloprotease family protein [Candidatus Glassbacteria bacterium]